jgi:hypothetical protein
MTAPDDRDDLDGFTITDLINRSEAADRALPCYPGTPLANPNDPPAYIERIRGAIERSQSKQRRAAPASPIAGGPARRDASGPAPRPAGRRAGRANPGRHERLCAICNHPDREAIEFDFLHWRNPYDICRQHHIRDGSSIYRHAHATGLFALRRRNRRWVLERLVERVDEANITDIGILRALREYNRLNDDGQWPPDAPEEDSHAPQEDSRAPHEAPNEDDGEANNQPDRQTLPERPRRQASLPPASAAGEFTPSLIGAPASPIAGGPPSPSSETAASRPRPPRKARRQQSLAPLASPVTGGPVPTTPLLQAPGIHPSEATKGAEGNQSEGSVAYASQAKAPAEQRTYTIWPIGRWRPRFWPGAPTEAEESDPPETPPREGQQPDSPSGVAGRREE